MPSDEEWADADMLADQVAGHPLARSAAEGIRDMTRRIETLEGRLAQCRAQLAAGADPIEFKAEEIRLIREIQEARSRLAEYQTQLDGRN